MKHTIRNKHEQVHASGGLPKSNPTHPATRLSSSCERGAARGPPDHIPREVPELLAPGVEVVHLSARSRSRKRALAGSSWRFHPDGCATPFSPFFRPLSPSTPQPLLFGLVILDMGKSSCWGCWWLFFFAGVPLYGYGKPMVKPFGRLLGLPYFETLTHIQKNYLLYRETDPEISW